MGYIVGVCSTCGDRQIFYDNIEDYEQNCEICDDGTYVEVNEKEYETRDYVNIMEDDLTNGNYHSIVELPELIYNTMNKYDVPDEKMKYIMQELSKKIWNIL